MCIHVFVTVAEQVTAATQQRDLQESGNSDELQLELTPQHQSTTHTGDVWIFRANPGKHRKRAFLHIVLLLLFPAM